MNQEQTPSMKKWYIPVFLIGLAIGYIGLNNGCNVDNVSKETTEETATDVDNITANDTPTDSTANEPTNKDEGLKSVTLPGGKEIAFEEGSTTEKIVAFLNADEMDMKQGFDLDGSDRQIGNIVALLEVYSDFNIKISGNADATSKVKSALITKGIDAKRLNEIKEKGNTKLYFAE